MSDEPEKTLDVLLKWKDEGTRDRAPSMDVQIDMFEGERSETSDDAVVEGVAVEDAESHERFQYTHERDAAIEAALRQMSEVPSPRVHAQLERICDALEARTLDGAGASALLDEVESYLAAQIEKRQRVPAVSDELLQAARSQVLDGLHLYADVVSVLRSYVAGGSPAELIMARRLADQAAGFLLNARDALLDARPEAEEPAAEETASEAPADDSSDASAE